MKPSSSSKYTTGDGSILIEVRSKGAPITPEARERARKRAEAVRTDAATAAGPQKTGFEPDKTPDRSE